MNMTCKKKGRAIRKHFNTLYISIKEKSIVIYILITTINIWYAIIRALKIFFKANSQNTYVQSADRIFWSSHVTQSYQEGPSVTP